MNVNNNISDELPITVAIPQGSVLSLLFILLYINDLLLISERSDFLIYDITIALSEGKCLSIV